MSTRKCGISIRCFSVKSLIWKWNSWLRSAWYRIVLHNNAMCCECVLLNVAVWNVDIVSMNSRVVYVLCWWRRLLSAPIQSSYRNRSDVAVGEFARDNINFCLYETQTREYRALANCILNAFVAVVVHYLRHTSYTYNFMSSQMLTWRPKTEQK